MRTILRVLGMVAIVAVAGFQSIAAADTLPSTFLDCFFAGGDVRAVGGDITCRYIRSSDMRIYGMVETECGEMAEIEIWDVTHSGVLTYAFAPGRTRVLPEVGDPSASWPLASPIPCLRN